eukprot:364033-Chlamydomonas_euryale.AAC.3
MPYALCRRLLCVCHVATTCPTAPRGHCRKLDKPAYSPPRPAAPHRLIPHAQRHARRSRREQRHDACGRRAGQQAVSVHGRSPLGRGPAPSPPCRLPFAPPAPTWAPPRPCTGDSAAWGSTDAANLPRSAPPRVRVPPLIANAGEGPRRSSPQMLCARERGP